MRKWMRERVKRRKKPEDKPEGEAAQAPLQPAYFEAGHPEPGEVAAESKPPRREPESATKEVTPTEEAAPEGSSQPGSDGDAQRRKRRRRGRGGRGRGGAKRSPSSQPEQPAGESEPAASESAPSAARQPAAHAVAEASPAAASSQAKAPRGVVVLAIGLPGSGKSSWFKRHNITALSSDLLRSLLFDDPQEQRFQDLVFSNLRSMLKARLIARRPMNYVDATNLSAQERHGWIKLAKDYGYEVQAVFFDVPIEVCLERNQRRQRQVPEDVMRRMSSKLRPPTFEEGFTKITVVKVKKKEGSGE